MKISPNNQSRLPLKIGGGLFLLFLLIIVGGWFLFKKNATDQNIIIDNISQEAESEVKEQPNPQVLGKQKESQKDNSHNSSLAESDSGENSNPQESNSTLEIKEGSNQTQDSENPKDETNQENDESEKNKNGEEDEKEDAAEKPPIKQDLVSFGHQKTSGRKIDTIILHSSYDALGDEPYSYSGLVEEYRQYGVAAHYLIDRKGKIYQLVRDQDIAYHAGQSQVPDGRTSVNSFSLGIEIMNTKEENYTKSQYQALNELLNYLEDQYSIKYTLGHNDIAPDRKTDPWNFDWDKIK